MHTLLGEVAEEGRRILGLNCVGFYVSLFSGSSLCGSCVMLDLEGLLIDGDWPFPSMYRNFFI